MTTSRLRIKTRILNVFKKDFFNIENKKDINNNIVTNPKLSKTDYIGLTCYNNSPSSIGLCTKEVDFKKSHEWITVLTRDLPIYNMEGRDVCVIYIYDNRTVYLKPFSGISKGVTLSVVLGLLAKARIRYRILGYDISRVMPYVNKSSTKVIKDKLAMFTTKMYAPITNIVGVNAFMTDYSPVERFSSIMAFWLEKPILERFKKQQEMDYILHSVPVNQLPRA